MAVTAVNSSMTTVTTPPVMMSPVSWQAAPFSNASLYIGDLDTSVTEAQLAELFGQYGPVVSVRVCRDRIRNVSLGYAYVNYHDSQQANQALELLNFTPLNGKPIRIMFSHRDPTIRKSGYANLFIKNLDSSIDNKSLLETFSSFGTVLSCKVVSDSNGNSKGFGYVQFEQQDASQKAIMKLNGMLMNGKQVQVGYFIRRQDRDRANQSLRFTNVYAKNLCESVTDDDLKEKFSCCGKITKAVVMKDEKGNSRGFGFINFEKPDDAMDAVQKFNGETFKDKVLYVGRAQKKVERVAELKAKYEQNKVGRIEKLKAANLYLKNLDDTVDEEKLTAMFTPFGKLLSVKVMLDPQGLSKGYGFVQFSSPEEANRALNDMNGQMVGKKRLYVAVAQRKEERTATLQARFALRGAPWTVGPAIASIPGYHPGSGRSAQPFYAGHGSAGFVPVPPGYAFQQQLVNGIQSGVSPNYPIPYHLQREGQTRQRLGVSRGMPHHMQHPQMIHHDGNQSFRYMQNGMVMPQGFSSPVMSLPPNTSVGSVNASRFPSIPALETALASAAPGNQRSMLGEELYPLVQRIEGENTSKITGMLLEMEPNDILQMIKSPDELKKKVEEAMQVLRGAQGGVPA